MNATENHEHGPRAQVLIDDWQLQSSYLLDATGDAVSSLSFDARGWHPTRVPATVLSALVKDRTYPDPRCALDTYRIPDASDEFNEQHDLTQFSHLPGKRNPWRDPWWYRTEFQMPSLAPDRHVWLTLNCLNYRAEVWVNGAKIADREQLVGMFQRFRLDITGHVTPGRNILAILVYPVDHPGVPDTQLEVFGKVRGFHKDICNDVTFLPAIQIAVPDVKPTKSVSFVL